MGLQQIDMPDHFPLDSIDPEADRLIEVANEQIERFMLSDQKVIENFVTCDFHLTQCALQWIRDNHLLTGERFCELGSGSQSALKLNRSWLTKPTHWQLNSATMPLFIVEVSFREKHLKILTWIAKFEM